MDYLKQPVLFKVRKVLRYCGMYGVRRTYVKMLAHLHMRRRYEKPPTPTATIGSRQIVGIIGCGNYSFTTIAYYLRRRCGDVIGACMDRNLDRAASMAQRYRIPLFTTSAEHIFEHERIRLVYIASNHASHASYAVEALERGKDVYVEKPHVVSERQLELLVDAMERTGRRVFLGFNRPGSRFGRIIRENLARESGAGMYNWFVAGHAIDPDHWYFRPEEGGRVLGNLCHWTDFTLQLVPDHAYPIEVTPTRAEKSDCDIVVTFKFADGTIGVISFSAKGHAFEGVMERLSAQKGHCLITMDDYRRMVIQHAERKRRYFNLFRDHGHARNIVDAFTSVRDAVPFDGEAQRAYVWNTGWLFLQTRAALEQNRPLVVEPFEKARRGWQGEGRSG